LFNKAFRTSTQKNKNLRNLKMHGGGWWALIGADETKGKAKVDRKLLKRILFYARPYWVNITVVLA
jgi:hypothetical protein